MAGPKTPRELADRMRDHRAQHRARDGFVRETFTQPRDDARQTVREFLDRYPKPENLDGEMPRKSAAELEAECLRMYPTGTGPNWTYGALDPNCG